MKKLLTVLLLGSFSINFAAQENRLGLKDKLTRELQRPSTQRALVSAGLLGAGICLNHVAMPDSRSEDYKFLADAMVALPLLTGGYLVRESYVQPRVSEYIGGLGLAMTGLLIQQNAVYNCPFFSVNHHASKYSDDFFSYQCTHPTDDGDLPSGFSWIPESLFSIEFLFFAGVLYKSSLLSRIEERNVHELLPDPTNINNQEVPLLRDVEVGFENVLID